MPSKKPRVNAVLPDHLFNAIEHLANTEERSLSQMAAILLREALKARGFNVDSDRSGDK